MAQARTVATLLPITAFSLKEPYARARFMIDNGCAVALATDFNPGSCFSESIPLLFSLATIYMGMTPEESVTALTINGAAAIGREQSIGSLDVGKAGDAVLLEFPSYRYIPYHIGVNCVEEVIKKGQIVVDRNKKRGYINVCRLTSERIFRQGCLGGPNAWWRQCFSSCGAFLPPC
jgi:imidazolonepropionase